MPNPDVWNWLLIACVLFAGEIFITSGFLLWIGLAACVSALLKFLIPGMGWEVQYSLFAVFSVLSMLAWKRFGKLSIESDQPTLNQRNQQYVGRVLTLAEAIENGTGKVIVDDTQWKVAGNDAVKGSQVRVTGADGNILLVEKVES